jgi:rare lipoprotein A
MKATLGKKLKRVFYVSFLVIAFVAATTKISSDASFVYLEGIASWYSEFSPGIRPTTANMERFDHSKMTCAIRGLPFDSVIEVTNLNNGRRVLVRVNDRGPAKRLCREGRIIDLTMAAFQEIEELDTGLANVKMRVVR